MRFLACLVLSVHLLLIIISDLEGDDSPDRVVTKTVRPGLSSDQAKWLLDQDGGSSFQTDWIYSCSFFFVRLMLRKLYGKEELWYFG